MECQSCGLVFLSSFNHINDQFYEDSSMLGGSVDLRKYRINSSNDDLRRYQALKESILNKRVLDFGCGGGGFLKLAQEISQSVGGVELDSTIRQALNEVDQIQTFRSVEEITGEYDLITLFHVLEHLPDPVAMLKRLKESLSANGKLIIEVPSANDALLTLFDSKPFADFTYWSCHLFLFTPETLSKVAELAGYKVHYIKQVQRYPLSNHLHWLSRNKPGGHQVWDFMNAPELHSAYEKQLASAGMCDTLFACITR
ncbi:class I SAM-dependent methyltransferase [Paenibacillus sp. OV219]|uniref:class I SAM-dependent methyltransferase n=1 Tax=Paenibacillus sp. OV219 TaxID=1884377 RepID=UPI0008BCD438|nr:class I SAM-dependent methyltransferase [Paenibacillus sp. OV219]SEN65696.1 2-polyprenyl-3-methyl-5-hydroxy-6-metoxy-1,4-benzoquinol methylase [Paenibacillus sp. OV219]